MSSESCTSKNDAESPSQAPRGKRYERDRRGNWGRNERRKEWVGKGDKPSDVCGSSQESGNKEGKEYDDSNLDVAIKGEGDRKSFLSKPREDYSKTSRDPKSKSRDSKDGPIHSKKEYLKDVKHEDGKKDFKQDRESKSYRDTRESFRECREKRVSKSQHDKSFDGAERFGDGKNRIPEKKDSRSERKSYREHRHSESKDERKPSRSDEKHYRDDIKHGKDKGKLNTDKNSGAELLDMLQKKSSSKQRTGTGREEKSKIKSASDLESQWIKEEEDKKRKEESKRRKEETERKIREETEKKRKEEEERLRMIEEKKQKEEERKLREEEERKKKEEEDAAQRILDEKRMLDEYIAETKERNLAKALLRSTNLQSVDQRPDDNFFSKLDSNLKKNTAFVKKIKNLNESLKEELTKDFSKLNLTKYIGEVAVAITEAKLKMSDIPCAVHMCSLLHQRYAEFSPVLLENWNKVLPSKKDEKPLNPSKLRVDLRVFAELVSVGIFTERVGLGVLANQLLFLTSNDKEEHNNLSILLSFAKHCGDDYADLLSRKIRLLGAKYELEIPKSSFLPPERQKACRNLLKDYFQSLSKHLLKDHKELQRIEKQNRKILHTRGELSEERKDEYSTMQQAFRKLLASAEQFADAVDEELPPFPVEDFDEDAELGLSICNAGDEFMYDGDSTLFEDEDTRTFYENLPDLKALIPSILYKDSENLKGTADESDIDADAELSELNVEDIEQEIEMSVNQSCKSDDTNTAIKATDVAPPSLDLEVDASMKHAEKLKNKPFDDDADLSSCLKMVLDAFISNLPTLVNRELIDKAAIDFCTNLNTKYNRKKLVRALFTVQRTRYDLLPFYSRLVAVLHPCMPDVAADLCTAIKGDFRWHVKKKDQINIESKLKSVRFIGELVKFGMFSKAEALHCLKMLLFDFSHHNIEMACALLDNCGRFLYRSSDTHHRTKVYLELMMRKKTALTLDSRYATLIENAYYYSNPPESSQQTVKERPILHQYVRRLLYKDLSKVNTERVLRQLRKLDWDNEEIVAYTVKCMTNIFNVRYNSIHCAANLLAGIAPYHEEIAIHVVDGVLEDIRLGMEINHPKFNQRRVSSVKYLGELYNYRMVESAVIFRTLYSFITFGVSLDESQPSILDPPEHLFRIRLVCVLLDACGGYFDRGSSKKKLDCFLTYFQRYFWFKKHHPLWVPEERPFPRDVDYLMQETIEALRPKLKMYKTYEEAESAAQELDAEFRAKLAAVLPTEGEIEEDEEDGLRPITEENEETDDLSQNLSQLKSGEAGSSQDSEVDGNTGSHTPGSHSQSHSQGWGHSQEPRTRRHTTGDEDDMLESAGEEEDQDQVALITEGVKHISCQEDDDFMAAFDKMMVDSIQVRSNEVLKVPSVDIAVPMHLKGQKKEYHTPPTLLDVQSASEKESSEQLHEEEPDNTIKFTLLTKLGSKQKFATLNVPISTEFANKFQERKQAERIEKEKMKQVVLDIHERQEEEDYQEMLASFNRMSNNSHQQPRERKIKFQHPKGAPDADKIFT